MLKTSYHGQVRRLDHQKREYYHIRASFPGSRYLDQQQLSFLGCGAYASPAH